MKGRLTIHQGLKTVLGSSNVYFQPPETSKIKYPAIIYNLSDYNHRQADNKNYLNFERYTATYVHKDPDVDLTDEMFKTFSMCRFDRRYVKDNLYHDVYSIYY